MSGVRNNNDIYKNNEKKPFPPHVQIYLVWIAPFTTTNIVCVSLTLRTQSLSCNLQYSSLTT